MLPVLAREDEQEAVLAAKRIGFAGLAGSFAEIAKTLSVLIDRGVSEFFLGAP